MIPHPARSSRRPGRRVLWTGLALAAAVIAGLFGCSPNPPLAPVFVTDEQISPDAIIVPANVPWIDTGLDVVAGQPLTIVGKGRISIGRLKKVKADAERDVGPRGTFFYGDTLAGKEFPLPAAGNGPAPCFCLIGRNGYGPVFYVGNERSSVAEQSGRLWLG